MLNPVQPRSGRIPKFGGEKEDGGRGGGGGLMNSSERHRIM